MKNKRKKEIVVSRCFFFFYGDRYIRSVNHLRQKVFLKYKNFLFNLFPFWKECKEKSKIGMSSQNTYLLFCDKKHTKYQEMFS